MVKSLLRHLVFSGKYLIRGSSLLGFCFFFNAFLYQPNSPYKRYSMAEATVRVAR